MPNTFLKPSVIVAAALGLLQREIVVPGLLWTDAASSFAGAAGDTVTIRVPAKTSARRRALRGTGNARTIVMDELSEQGVDVTLTDDVYNAVPITDEELSLDIKDFGVQVLTPQVRAVAEGLEDLAVEGMQNSTFAGTQIIDPAGTYGSAVDARQKLNDADVPRTQRAMLVGSSIESAILKDPDFYRVDNSGSDQALREALIGRVAGFDVYGSNALLPDEGYAFHKTAWALGMRAPQVPAGVSFGQGQTFQNLAMRWIRDYDFANVQDRSLVDCFAGIAPVEDDGAFVRAVRLELKTASITVSPASKTLAAGESQQLTVDDANGDAVPGGSVGWTTSNAAVATVSATGKVTAVATGTATITASYQGQTGTSAITVS